MFHKTNLSEKINQCAKEWDASGAVAVVKDGEWYHENFYGFADKEKHIPVIEESTYLISYNSRFLMGLCIGKLLDEKKIKLSDTLDTYIPEYNHASEITLKQLCLKQSGIPDFFNSGIMKMQQEDKEYQNLSDESRNIRDRKLLTYPWTFKDALMFVNEKALTCLPGTEPTDDLDNLSETLFMREVIERSTGRALPDYMRTAIFAPIGIKGEYQKPDTNPYAVYHMTSYVNSGYEENAKYSFVINYREAKNLLEAVLDKSILSEKAWKAVTAPATYEQSIAFNSISGLLSARDLEYGSTGWSCYLYLNWNEKLGLLHLTNSELIEHSVGGDGISQFRKEFRQEVAAAFVYPKDTKLIPFNKVNLWDAMELSIEDEQLEYMSNAKRAICIAYAYKQKLFVLMEGKYSVGLVAFKVDKKKEKYYIESVLIDKKYQQRGFGKIMMIQGLAYLKSQGCKYLTIGVHRLNTAALKLYKSVGFNEKTVYEGFVEMEMYL